MLTAERTGFWRSRYTLLLDGAQVTTWDSSVWRSGGSFTLQDQTFSVRANGWGTKYTMTDGSGAVVAEAAKVNRKNWTVAAGGRTFDFQRTSVWRNDQQMLHNGMPVGTIRKTSSWTGNLEADLPGLDLPVQIFVLGVLIAVAEAAAAAAAA
ncbi:hypothetical protein FB565_003994 [Actinoplanes lutulentus]|uniref:Uncharacterized protein n=1 Tax=Actinoplanes lutulentus TaxID=1287878 RepID=A0A327ZHZ2_9ACTN|nr:hypothetical protein [Actinoplanes lutulentus]MBB2944265.1 hypothetical protein [Actinoplanes lutulentus]RAK42502.1 hypothetical protein B0I29_102327 [Actinoplanes lutulentus]